MLQALFASSELVRIHRADPRRPRSTNRIFSLSPIYTDSLVRPFQSLAHLLDDAGWREGAGRSGSLSGGPIMLRLLAPSKRDEEAAPSPAATGLLAALADE
jgi:hypothetical protein